MENKVETFVPLFFFPHHTHAVLCCVNICNFLVQLSFCGKIAALRANGKYASKNLYRCSTYIVHVRLECTFERFFFFAVIVCSWNKVEILTWTLLVAIIKINDEKLNSYLQFDADNYAISAGPDDCLCNYCSSLIICVEINNNKNKNK